MAKAALATGITGQDGAYLSRFLLGRGYDVRGLLARRSSDSLWRLHEVGIADDVELIDGDLGHVSPAQRIVQSSAVDEVYSLAAPSFVATSWQQPVLTAQVTGVGALNVLEAIRVPASVS
jgi:GDPmannose 4,6-dehydratase